MEKQTEKTLRNRLLGVIHIKKKRLRITEEQYRNFLWEFFEVTSASQLYEDGLQAIIRLLDRWDKKTGEAQHLPIYLGAVETVPLPASAAGRAHGRVSYGAGKQSRSYVAGNT